MATSLTYTGFSTTSQTTTLYDLEIAKADLMNHFMTRRGERVMAPQFGSIIWDFLFDPLTPELLSIIQDDVMTIVRSDPRFDIQTININEVEQGILLTVDLYYYPMESVDTLSITFDKNAQEAR